MRKHYFYDTYKEPIVLSLGFFDCIHIGHLSLIEESKKLAFELGSEMALMTFANDPNPMLKKSKQIYTIQEREFVLSNLGLEGLIYANFDDEFSNISGEEFLNILTTNFNIKAVVVGNDYCFGSGASCDVEFLKRYLVLKNITLKIVPFERRFEKKIATTSLKNLVLNGEIEVLNTFLTQPYFIFGKIVHGKRRGTNFGFPTANLESHCDSLQLASGVYATKLLVDGKEFLGMTNVGSKPTFCEGNYTVETNLFDFDMSIYGKNVMLEFYAKIRDVAKFDSILELKNQLQLDEVKVRNYFCKTQFNNQNIERGGDEI